MNTPTLAHWVPSIRDLEDAIRDHRPVRALCGRSFVPAYEPAFFDDCQICNRRLFNLGFLRRWIAIRRGSPAA